MTNEELAQRFERMATAVERVTEASAAGIRQLTEHAQKTDERIQQLANHAQKTDERIRQLVNAQLGTQAMIGLLSQTLLESRERDDLSREEQRRLWEEQRQLWQENQRRHQESDQRFNILLEEIRHLRRLHDERNG